MQQEIVRHRYKTQLLEYGNMIHCNTMVVISISYYQLNLYILLMHTMLQKIIAINEFNLVNKI